jgi:stress response protein YsnF
MAMVYLMVQRQEQTRKGESNQLSSFDQDQTTKTIPVIHEQAVVHKEIVETGKVQIKKTFTQEDVKVNLPIISESYDIERVPVKSKLIDAPPPPVRYEGDIMIIPAVKEITVIPKKYEVVEELRITRRLTKTHDGAGNYFTQRTHSHKAFR